MRQNQTFKEGIKDLHFVFYITHLLLLYLDFAKKSRERLILWIWYFKIASSSLSMTDTGARDNDGDVSDYNWDEFLKSFGHV